VFILTLKQKSGLQFLSFFSFPASLATSVQKSGLTVLYFGSSLQKVSTDFQYIGCSWCSEEFSLLKINLVTSAASKYILRCPAKFLK
jgi:hypothetical protein